MNTRLKEVRKSQVPKMSQEKFAEALGTTRNAYKSYEAGIVVPNNTFIKLLCSHFGINEHWLLTGEGDMHAQNENPILVELHKHFQMDELDDIIISSYLELPADARESVKAYISMLGNKISKINEDSASEYKTTDESVLMVAEHGE